MAYILDDIYLDEAYSDDIDYQFDFLTQEKPSTAHSSFNSEMEVKQSTSVHHREKSLSKTDKSYKEDQSAGTSNKISGTIDTTSSMFDKSKIDDGTDVSNKKFLRR